MGQNMIDLDIRLREIVQREDFLINQCEKAEELLDDLLINQYEKAEELLDDPKRQQQLDEWQTELRNLEQSYWKTERMLYANDLLCPIVHEEAAAVVERADAVRNHAAPHVPMATDIVQKCAVAVSGFGDFP
ncbi:hypothetical protein N7465_001164 [Penicillium sp. CMV-2018d]|nr:hypothetical protein N7465_001164 [Penicillium sp. CMV-2018d]